MAYLRHWYNGNTISIYQLGGDVSIGRHPECSIHVDDATVSAQHATIRHTDGGYELKDTASTNGIRIAGKQVASCLLSDGQKFALGTQEFEFLQCLPEDLDKTLKIKKSWIPGVWYAESGTPNKS